MLAANQSSGAESHFLAEVGKRVQVVRVGAAHADQVGGVQCLGVAQYVLQFTPFVSRHDGMNQVVSFNTEQQPFFVENWVFDSL